MFLVEKNSGVMEIIIVATVMILLGLLDLYVTPLFLILLPVPLAYLIIKRDLIKALWALVLVTVMLVLVTGLQSAFLMVLQFGSLGIIIGLLLKNRVAVDKSMGVLLFWALVVTAINLFFIFVISGAGISQVTNEFRITTEQMISWYSQNDMLNEAEKKQFLKITEQVVGWVQVYFYGSVAVCNIINTLAAFFITIRLARGIGFDMSGQFRLTEWRLPWYSIWLFIVGLALTIAGDEFSIYLLKMVGKNILYVAAVIFFLLGSTVLGYYFRAWKLAKIIKIIIIIVFILYLPFTVMITLALGVVDSVTNLRRLPTSDDEGTKGGS